MRGVPGEVLAGRTHVLVKGWHESGAVEAVYGPYSEARCEWLRTEFTDGSANHWSTVPLSDFAEPPPGGIEVPADVLREAPPDPAAMIARAQSRRGTEG
jgi:hypothetical protein